ncbi:MAG: ferritin family protein [candidate division Zixibacteria bacterium]|nr:ferritin family protein [candidate division Zixibacteria bacterium]MDH3938932.1 ferritin family protein [candidate division Zixibacteria bacterium]MDH4035297.1 ferritin family protein [candidate division Zixibacteria bacterium]
MSAVHPDTLAALTSGIQSEVASYVFYIEAAKKVEDSELRESLKQLAGEEKDHFQILERQYDSLVRSEKWISTADVLMQNGLPEIDEEMTQQHRQLIDEVAGTETVGSILEIALRLEEEARDLFTQAAARSESDEGRQMFERLSKFEEGHVGLIRQMISRFG